MVITHHGKQFFKITQGDLTIAFNPISKESSFKGKVPSFGADIVFITTNHPDYNGTEAVSYGNKDPFVIDGPGDYEIKDIFVHGLMTKTEIGKEEYINTIYFFELDGMTLCFLGALNDPKLPPEIIETIGEPDILFVPIGGENVLDPSGAHKLVNSLDAKAIIPMDYENGKEHGALQTFLKEAGDADAKPVEKLTLKKKDIQELEGASFVLTY